MKLLLIVPTSLNSKGEPVKFRKAYLPPLSLATIAGLTPRQHQVRVVNDLVETIDFDTDVDLVGLTAMSAQSERAYQIADEFRRRGRKVVIGGIHASMLPEEVKPHADAVVVGEAENIWEQVLVDAEHGQLKEFYKDTEHPDLARAVIPRWECFDMSIYPRQPGAKLPMMPIFTTRGCPYGCRFCAVTKFSGVHYRTRPISSVLSEVEGTGAKEFFFVDDNIAAKPEYSRELFLGLKGKGLRWMSQISTMVLKNPELLELAADAGCFALFVGVESLNKKSLAGAHKSFNKIELYDELLQRMRKAGIIPFLSFVFGFDEDTPDQFETTIEFLTKNKVGSAVFWILTPMPGTDLFADMQSQNRLTSNHWSNFDGTKVMFKTKSWAPENLTQSYWNALDRLYRPPRLFRNVLWNAQASREPVRALVRGLFYQSYFWMKIREHEHPYSGGIGRLTPR